MFLVWQEEYMTYHSTCLSVAKQSIGAPGQLLLLLVSDWVCKSKHWALPNTLIAGIWTLSSSLWWSRLSIHSVDHTTYCKSLARIDLHKRKKNLDVSLPCFFNNIVEKQTQFGVKLGSWKPKLWCERVNSQKHQVGASEYDVVKRAGIDLIREER
jgi:hypothetical protein